MKKQISEGQLPPLGIGKKKQNKKQQQLGSMRTKELVKSASGTRIVKRKGATQAVVRDSQKLHLEDKDPEEGKLLRSIYIYIYIYMNNTFRAEIWTYVIFITTQRWRIPGYYDSSCYA